MSSAVAVRTRTLGYVVRAVLPVVIAGLLLAGSLVGEDDNFPFGPFRMYSTKQELDARIRALELWALTDGRWEPIRTSEFGLRRADLEGQLGKLEQPPEVVLARLAASYPRLHDEAFPFGGLQFRQRIHQLEGGVPVDERVELIATWLSS